MEYFYISMVIWGKELAHGFGVIVWVLEDMKFVSIILLWKILFIVHLPMMREKEIKQELTIFI